MVLGFAFFSGVIYSIYYPFTFALPQEFGKTFSGKNSSNVLIFYAIGEGMLVSAVGYLMMLTPLMLMVSCLIMAIINRFIIGKCM